MTTKQFHLGDILSITTGILCSPSKIHGVYEILNFMTNDDLFTHQLVRASNECKPYLLDQFPQLSGVDASGVNQENVWRWLDEQVAKFGERFDVAPIPMDDHDVIDPAVEFRRMTGRDVLTVDDSPESIKALLDRLADTDEGESEIS